jgi:PadR family transcriptional regulator, regulatory protein PadR
MRGDPVRGQVDLLLLAVLADEPAHGYRVIERLRERSGGIFDLQEGTVYPALHRLEKAGCLESRWAEEAGRRRRVYRLTSRGRAELEADRERWRRFSGAVGGVLGISGA